MRQITVLLAVSSPTLCAKMRGEVIADPELVLVGEADAPSQAIVETRRFEPQIVLCDHGMLSDGQMSVLAQQAYVVSLLVLVTPDDESWLPRLTVPVAGTVSAHHRPGDLVNKLQAIINAPVASLEPSVALDDRDPAVVDQEDLKPLAYDPAQVPSISNVPDLVGVRDPDAPIGNAGAFGMPMVKSTSLLKRVVTMPGGASGKP